MSKHDNIIQRAKQKNTFCKTCNGQQKLETFLDSF